MTEKEKNPDLILRDWLAIERTKLANERTFLSYFRTALFILVSGVTILKIEELHPLLPMGYILVVLSPILLGIGLYRYIKVKRDLNQHSQSEK